MSSDMALNRKTFLINELIRIGADLDMDKPLSAYSLFELEHLHITEKCKSENVFASVHKTWDLKYDENH